MTRYIERLRRRANWLTERINATSGGGVAHDVEERDALEWALKIVTGDAGGQDPKTAKQEFERLFSGGNPGGGKTAAQARAVAAHMLQRLDAGARSTRSIRPFVEQP